MLSQYKEIYLVLSKIKKNYTNKFRKLDLHEKEKYNQNKQNVSKLSSNKLKR